MKCIGRVAGPFLTLFLAAGLAFAQANEGSQRLSLIDNAGHPIAATVQLASPGNEYAKILTAANNGALSIAHLPFGVYQLTVRQPGFVLLSRSIQIRSSAPTEIVLQLHLAPLVHSVTVHTSNTLLALRTPALSKSSASSMSKTSPTLSTSSTSEACFPVTPLALRSAFPFASPPASNFHQHSLAAFR